jgi:2-keto-3-deoxy-6-phosphogluconate aldolase
MATGGVSSDNVQEFIKNGADAVSFGASIFKMEWLENGEYDKVQEEINKLVTNYRKLF